MAWAILKRSDARSLQPCDVTRPRIGGGLASVFRRGVFVRVPGENNPVVRAVRYVSVPGFGGKANGQLPI
jgi:hypothetical protein